MPIDPSIPMSVRTFNLADIMRDAEAQRVSEQQREVRQFQLDQMRAEAGRKDEHRRTLADLVLADSSGLESNGPTTQGLSGLVNRGPQAPQPQNFAEAFSPNAMDAIRRGETPENASSTATGQPATQQQPSQQDNRRAKWEAFVHSDPDGAVDYRKSTESWQAEHFKLAHNLSNAVLVILGSVYDQPSYERAKNAARSLYSRYGVNLDDLDLPDQYSPELINGLRNEALDTKQQILMAQRDRKLDADIEDDQADNARADRNTDSLITDRSGRRAETQRYHGQRDATTRRGQDVRERTTTRGQDVRAATGGKRGQGYAATAVGPNGQRIHYDAGKKAWVNEQGAPVQ